MESLLGLNRDKPRVYIALYDLDGVFGGGVSWNRGVIRQRRQYQWALLLESKQVNGEKEHSTGWRYIMRRVETNDSPPRVNWEVESAKVRLGRHDSILVRILVGKVTDIDRFGGILEGFGISATVTEEPRTHKTWIRELVKELRKDGKCCKYLPEWEYIESESEEFASKANFDTTVEVPTLDIISGSRGKAGTKQPVVIDVQALRAVQELKPVQSTVVRGSET